MPTWLAATIAISALLPSAGRASKPGECYTAQVPYAVTAPDGAAAAADFETFVIAAHRFGNGR